MLTPFQPLTKPAVTLIGKCQGITVRQNQGLTTCRTCPAFHYRCKKVLDGLIMSIDQPRDTAKIISYVIISFTSEYGTLLTKTAKDQPLPALRIHVAARIW